MQIQAARLIAVFGVLVLSAATLDAQGTAPRGVTRLESGGLRLLHGSTAVYPEAARKAGVEGTVVIKTTLDAKGHVIDAQVVSGPMELRAAALKSILDDHFASDAPAARSVEFRVLFTLDKTPPRNVPSSAGKADDPAPNILSTECPLLPMELCRDAQTRLAAHVGSPLTTEVRAEVDRNLEELDDHLSYIQRKATNGVVLVVYLRQEDSSSSLVLGGIPGGVVGGIPAGAFTGTAAAPPPPPPPPPKPADASMQRIRVAGTVQATKLIRRVTPIYPPIAKTSRIQGAVKFSAVIGKDGTVTNLSLISGSSLLVPAALEAAKQWQYQTTTVNGNLVEVATEIDVNFTLDQ